MADDAAIIAVDKIIWERNHHRLPVTEAGLETGLLLVNVTLST